MEGGTKVNVVGFGEPVISFGCQGYGVSLAVTTCKVAEVGMLVMVTRVWEVPAVTSTSDARAMPVLEEGLGFYTFLLPPPLRVPLGLQALHYTYRYSPGIPFLVIVSHRSHINETKIKMGSRGLEYIEHPEKISPAVDDVW